MSPLQKRNIEKSDFGVMYPATVTVQNVWTWCAPPPTTSDRTRTHTPAQIETEQRERGEKTEKKAKWSGEGGERERGWGGERHKKQNTYNLHPPVLHKQQRKNFNFFCVKESHSISAKNCQFFFSFFFHSLSQFLWHCVYVWRWQQ